MSELAIRLLRQNVMSTVAKYMANYINAMSDEELKATLGTNIVDKLEAELYAKVSQEKLQEWADKARPYIGCFSREDIATIYMRLVQRLNREKASIVEQHRDWLLGQMEEAWNRLLAALGQEQVSAAG